MNKPATLPAEPVTIDGRSMSKKELKDYVNANGFFLQHKITLRTNAPAADAPGRELVPNGAIYFRGIASTGEINRNGYIIRESAWQNAIPEYLSTNPAILLQHDSERPIGRCVWAQLTPNGLEVAGYIFDEETDERFSKGLFGALSTGHIDVTVEFENTETKQILSEDEYWGKISSGEIGWGSDNGWVLAVTELDWVEFSVVTIGSNKKSVITRTNAITNYFEKKNKVPAVKKNDAEEVTPPPAAPTEPITPAATTETQPSADADAPKEVANAGEAPAVETAPADTTPPASDPAPATAPAETPKEETPPATPESAGAPAGNAVAPKKVKVSQVEFERVQKAADAATKALNAIEPDNGGDAPAPEADEPKAEDPATTPPPETKTEPPVEQNSIEKLSKKDLAKVIGYLANEVHRLNEVVSKTPDRKVLAVSSQFGQALRNTSEPSQTEKPKSNGAALASLLAKVGVSPRA